MTAITLSKEELFKMLQDAAELGATIALKKAGVIIENLSAEVPKVNPKREAPLYKDKAKIEAMMHQIILESNEKIRRKRLIDPNWPG